PSYMTTELVKPKEPAKSHTSLDNGGLAVNAAARLEQQQRFAHGAHIMNSQDLHSLRRQRTGDADRTGRAVGIFIADQLPDKTLSRVADEQRQPAIVKPPAVGQER